MRNENTGRLDGKETENPTQEWVQGSSGLTDLQGRRAKDSGESLKNKSRTDRSPAKFPYSVEKLAITLEKMK